MTPYVLNVFGYAAKSSLQARLDVSKKPPVIKQIPKAVFVAAIIGPIVFAAIGIGMWNATRKPTPLGTHPPEIAMVDPSENPAVSRTHTGNSTSFSPSNTIESEDLPAAANSSPQDREFIQVELVAPNARSSQTSFRSTPAVSFIGFMAIGFLTFVCLFLIFIFSLLALRMKRASTRK